MQMLSVRPSRLDMLLAVGAWQQAALLNTCHGVLLLSCVVCRT